MALLWGPGELINGGLVVDGIAWGGGEDGGAEFFGSSEIWEEKLGYIGVVVFGDYIVEGGGPLLDEAGYEHGICEKKTAGDSNGVAITLETGHLKYNIDRSGSTYEH